MSNWWRRLLFWKKEESVENEEMQSLPAETEQIVASESEVPLLQQRIQELEALDKAKRASIEALTAELTQFRENNCLSASPTTEEAIAGGGDEEAVAKLQQKIKKLESEVEDLEDEVDDLSKSLKKKDAKCAELSERAEDADKAEKKVSELEAQLEVQTEKMEEVSRKNQLKHEALSFIQEVLTACPVSDKSSKQQYNAIDSMVQFIREDVKPFLQKWYELKVEDETILFGEGLERWASFQKKNWLKGKKTIAFVGEFSAGKTSIVNRILSQDNPNASLLPVSSKATTAIPTYISGSDKGARFLFVTPNDEQKVLPEKTFKRVDKETLEQMQGISALIKYFVMSCKNEVLKNLSVLDTPGFSSNDSEDSLRTIEVINECDALFWVFDVNAGTVNQSSLKTIKNNLRKPLYVIINKVDTKAPSEVQKVETLIRKTFAEKQVPVEAFLRFSAKEPLQSLAQQIYHVAKTEEVDLMQIVEEYLFELKEHLDREKRQKEGEAKEQRKHLGDIDHKFEEHLEKLNATCEYVADIPEFNSNFLSADNYKMSQEGYKQMEILLKQRIPEICKDIEEVYDARIDGTKNAMETSDERHSIQQDVTRAGELLQKFLVLKQNIKKSK